MDIFSFHLSFKTSLSPPFLSHWVATECVCLCVCVCACAVVCVSLGVSRLAVIVATLRRSRISRFLSSLLSAQPLHLDTDHCVCVCVCLCVWRRSRLHKWAAGVGVRQMKESGWDERIPSAAPRKIFSSLKCHYILFSLLKQDFLQMSEHLLTWWHNASLVPTVVLLDSGILQKQRKHQKNQVDHWGQDVTLHSGNSQNCWLLLKWKWHNACSTCRDSLSPLPLSNTHTHTGQGPQLREFRNSTLFPWWCQLWPIKTLR